MPTNFTVRGVTTDTVVGGWLVMTNGTLKISGTFAGTSRVFAAAGYTIPVSFGFWLNNPNYTVAAQAGSATNNGLLRVTPGHLQPAARGHPHDPQGFAGSRVHVEGGAVNCRRPLRPAAQRHHLQPERRHAQRRHDRQQPQRLSAASTLGRSLNVQHDRRHDQHRPGEHGRHAIDYQNQAGAGRRGDRHPAGRQRRDRCGEVHLQPARQRCPIW